ncbi:MAG: tubulin/FtsZ family protein [Halobaculum sp.]
MKIGLLGVGRAGGAVVDRLAETARESRVSPVEAAVVVDTDEGDLNALSAVPMENRHLIGQVEVAGTGTAGDQELAVEIASEAQAELRSALDAIPISRTDALVVVAGLSGGTGGGIAPCLAEMLREIVSQPIYGVGVLPSDAAEEPGAAAAGAIRSLRALREVTDDVLLVDLDQWRGTDQSVETAYDALDRDLADALWALFAASESDGNAPTPERMLDASEIVNTLRGNGVATLARAENALPEDETADDGLLGSVRGLLGDSTPDVDDVTATRLVTTTAREAIHSNVFLSTRSGDASRAALVIDAPAPFLIREGIQEATGIVEDETESVAVRAGDRPAPETDRLGATLLLSGITDSPRIDELEQRTREYLGGEPDEPETDLSEE